MSGGRPKPEEAQRRLRHDHATDVDAEDDDDRRRDVGQHVAQQRAPARAADRLRRLEVGVLLHPQHRAPRTTREAGMPPDTPSTTMICSMPRPGYRHDGEQQQQPRERHPGVDEALRHQVQATADEAGGAADQHRHHDGEDGGGQPHRQRQPCPVDEAAQQVAPDVVGAQQVRGRGGLQAVAQVDLLVAVGRQRIGEDADQHQDQDDDAAGGPQRLLAHQPREEPPQPGLPSRNRARAAGSATAGVNCDTSPIGATHPNIAASRRTRA